jgi:DNA-binding CsgD family transcriptional regulator
MMTRKMYDGIVTYPVALQQGDARERVMAHALATLTAGVPATRAWMWSVDHHGHRDGDTMVLLARGVQPQTPQQSGREYLERYWVDDPFSPHRFTDRRHRVVTLADIGGRDELHRTSYGREFLPESGFADRLCVHVWHDGRLSSAATLLRTPDEAPFTAREIAFLHQAQPLIAYAYAQGAREQRVAGAGSPTLLRPRQAEVAALAAQGLSNAEIARTLNISPETVKRHLSTIYKQLRIRSRIELAARLAART